MAGVNMILNVQDLTGAFAALTLGGVTTTNGYWCHFYNMAAVDGANPTLNHIVVTLDNTNHCITIPPASFFGPLRVNPAIVASVKVSGATCIVATGVTTLSATGGQVAILACEI
jgi:hypothetical protein